MVEPVWDGYFADPFVLRTDDGFVAYGTDPHRADGAAFSALVSPDLSTWRSGGPVLSVDPAIGTDYWAPEVVRDGDRWLMFYSAGRGIAGHTIRVGAATGPLGPFADLGLDLTPDASFAIDPHPFTDVDGSRWLFHARDVLDADRPGTHLAVVPMRTWTEPAGPAAPVLQPNADWQRYAANRSMYGRRMDWHTLEGPSVVRRGGNLILFYSGGSWEGPDYGVATAVASSPLGPWRHASDGAPDVLSGALSGLAGPGHNSLVAGPDGRTWIAFHAWDDSMERRRPYVAPLGWRGLQPIVLGLSSAASAVSAGRPA